jgi:RNA polymerase sigma factor (sigma-70 family)
MAGRPLNLLIRHLRAAARPRTPDGPTDAQLLERFVRSRDEAAFELLVWRHGAMVFNVCRRVLRRERDAEDAFQATFLALVRKGAAIGRRESVGGWLYKVAYRVALRAGAAVPVRPLPAEPLSDPAAADPAARALGREMGSVLDEEVNRLSDRYRVAFVLCHLEGQTIEAAARVLGCPPGTVGTRVARARDLLRRRLARRGYAPTAVGVSLVGAALSPGLVAATARAALLTTADQALAAGVISAHVADLTKGVLRTMSLTRWARAAVVILGLSLSGGVALVAHQGQAGEPPATKAGAATPRPPDSDEDAGAVLEWKFEKARPFYQEVTTETRQHTKVMANDVKQEQGQTFYFRWTPIKKDGENWELEQKIVGAKVDMDVGGERVRFDSTRDTNTAGALSDFYDALVGSEFRVTLNREYKVQKVVEKGTPFRKRVAANPALGGVLSQVLSEDALRLAAETPFAGLPRGPVRPGDSWSEKRSLDMGSAGEYRATYRYTYQGREDGLDKVKIRVEDLRLARPAEDGVFKIKNGELRCTEGGGTLLFDRARGRTTRLDLRLTVEGKLTLAGDAETVVELSQTEKVTVRTTDTDPVKRGAAAADARDREIERLKEENERLRRQLRAVEEALRRDGRPKE